MMDKVELYQELLKEYTSIHTINTNIRNTILEHNLSDENTPISDVNPNTFFVLNKNKINPISPMKSLVGGSNSSFLNKDLQPKLTYIFNYYYTNISENINSILIPKVLNNDEIQLIITSALYVYFIDYPYKNLDEIINPNFVNSIPQHFKFNFLDIIHQEISNINNIKAYIDNKSLELKKSLSNLTNIPSNTDQYHIVVYQETQSGGTNVDTLIANKIKKLSDLLKTESTTKQKGGDNNLIQKITHNINKYVHLINTINKYHNQIGGDLIDDMKTKKETLDNELQKIEKDAVKLKIAKEKMIENANIWVIELINEKYVNKVIEDNEYGITRFVLLPSKSNESNEKLIAILQFINSTASILRFKNDYEPDIFPNPIKIYSIGTDTKPTYITDKLTKYFNKKYEELQKLKEGSQQDKEKEKDVFFKIKEFLGFRGGALEDSQNFLEYCFTSRQYNKFIQKMEDYLKSYDKTIDPDELKLFKKQIQTIEDIEKELLKINELLINYKIINDQFPDKVRKNVTLQHMQNILKSNNVVIDEYGNLNLKTLDLVKKIERYMDIKEALTELQDPSVKKEVNALINKQMGGTIQSPNFNKSFMSHCDYEHFTTKTFQKVLDEINNEK